MVIAHHGAGHMPDLSERLEKQLGYTRVEKRWLRAIEVDLTTSAVSEQDVRRLRQMIQRTMRQMTQMNQKNRR